MSDASTGARREEVRLRVHDARWADAFDAEADVLRGVLDPLTPLIEHIGSTAVQGLVAKPLIDIALGFRHRAELERARGLLVEVGYDDRGDLGAAGGVVVAKGPLSERTHILHLVELADPQWARWLDFRDALRADAARRDAYAALKIALAERYPNDRKGYTQGKHMFIEQTISQAEERESDG